MGKPTIDGDIDQPVSLFKHRTRLPPGIRHWQIMAPFAQQESAATDLRRPPCDRVHVRVLHRQDQVRATQHGLIELARNMCLPVQVMFDQYFLCGCIDGMVYHGAKTRRRHRDITPFRLQARTEHYFSHGTAADIADAYDQYVVKHVETICTVSPLQDSELERPGNLTKVSGDEMSML